MCAGRRWRGKLSAWGESETQGKRRENTRAGLDGFFHLASAKWNSKEAQLLRWHRGLANMLKVVLDCSKTSAPPLHLERGQEKLYFSGHVPCKLYCNTQHFPCPKCRAPCRAVTSHASEVWLSQGTASPDAQHITTTFQETTTHEDGKAFKNHRQHPTHSAPAERFHSLTLAQRPFPLSL